MTKKGLSRSALGVWEGIAGLVAALLAGGVLWLLQPRTWLWYGSLWLIGLAFVLTAFLYLPLLYISCCYVLTEEYVEFQCGVIFFHRRRMLRSSVMYVTVMKDPVSVLTRTRTVVLHAMGGRLVIPFLPVREVSALLRAVSPRKPREERHV